jgi:hypothetical protein
MTKTINLKEILLATKYFDCEPKSHEIQSILYAMRKACNATADACSDVADAGPWTYATVEDMKKAILETKLIITDGTETD